MGEGKDLHRADIDAATAIRAVGREDEGRCSRFALQRGGDHVLFGAHRITVHAIVAGDALRRSHPDQAFPTDKTVERTDRAEMATPTMSRDEQIEQED